MACSMGWSEGRSAPAGAWARAGGVGGPRTSKVHAQKVRAMASGPQGKEAAWWWGVRECSLLYFKEDGQDRQCKKQSRGQAANGKVILRSFPNPYLALAR